MIRDLNGSRLSQLRRRLIGLPLRYRWQGVQNAVRLLNVQKALFSQTLERYRQLLVAEHVGVDQISEAKVVLELRYRHVLRVLVDTHQCLLQSSVIQI